MTNKVSTDKALLAPQSVSGKPQTGPVQQDAAVTKSGDSRERPAIDLDRQISCVARELAMRRNVYPKFVAAGKIKEDKARDELAAMEAVIETLKSLRWIPVAEKLPDDDLTVMILMDDGEIWTGFVDPEGWHYVSADPARGVKAWRSMPA